MKEEDLTEEKVAALKQKHGPDLEQYPLPDGDVLVFHKPSEFVWSRFLRDGAEDKKRVKALEVLVLSCLAAPDEAEGKAAIAKYPAVPLSALDVLTKLAGGGGETKKL
jgi:hypothetical protein